MSFIKTRQGLAAGQCSTRFTFARRGLRLAACVSVLLSLSGCGEVWTDPLPTATEYDKGLIVMYPGALVSESEMLGFFATFRLAGIDQAIEVPQWTTPVSFGIDPAPTFEQNKVDAVVEAQRIADYMSAHPDAPVTL